MTFRYAPHRKQASAKNSVSLNRDRRIFGTGWLEAAGIWSSGESVKKRREQTLVYQERHVRDNTAWFVGTPI
jgi:hypothetical protein